MRKQIKKKLKVQTEYGTFECTFTPDDKGYIALCPDIDGAVSWGKDFAEARHMIKGAIEISIETKVLMNVQKEGPTTLPERNVTPRKGR